MHELAIHLLELLKLKNQKLKIYEEQFSLYEKSERALLGIIKELNEDIYNQIK